MGFGLASREVISRPELVRNARLRCLRYAVAGGIALLIAGCGGGSVDVAVSAPPPVTGQALRILQTGPDQVQVDWTDDVRVHQYIVDRNGAELAAVMATTVIDTSVVAGLQYCYQVSGYDAAGNLVATTDTGCIVVSP